MNLTRHPVPPDAEEIHPGYFLHAAPERRDRFGWQAGQHLDTTRWIFSLYVPTEDRVISVARVNVPLTQSYRSRDHEPDSAMIQPRIRGGDLPDEVVRAVSAALLMSADFATVLNECYDEELDKQQREYDAYQRELKLANQRDLEQFEELYQKVIWLVGSKFRLRRRGKKATVFGTIDFVTPPREDGSAPPGAHMRTTSEKGVPMSIRLKDVIWMEIKHEDSSRRYDNIYTETLKEEVL